MNRIYLPLLVAVGGLAGIAGCTTVGPDYKAPTTAAPAKWTSPLSGDVSAQEVETNKLAQWWTVFNDPVLSDIIERARVGNLDVRQAEARVRQARAQRGMAQAGLFPGIGSSASASRTTSSKKAGNGQTSDFYSAGFDATWELDIFGGKRRAVESATASWQASQEGLQDVQVSLLAEAALNYVEIRSFQERVSITESNVLAQSETYDIARWRQEAGLTTQLDVDQARLSLEQARAQLPTLRTSLEQAKYRLSVLVGQAPGALKSLLDGTGGVPFTSEQVAIGVPADVIRRRPDVRNAERLLAAQTAQIGVAKADLYPKFSLVGSIGLESLESASLFTTGARAMQGAAKAAWTLFDAGSIRQNIRVQTARQEEALSFYEATVLTALKDVEDSLVAYANEQLRQKSLEEAVKAGQSAFKLARDQYSSGLVSFQTVLDTQQALLNAQDQLASSQASVTSDLIRLYKSLGGGWTPIPEPSGKSQTISQR